MEETLTITPNDIREGVPITVVSNNGKSEYLTVVPGTKSHLVPFQVPLESLENGKKVAQFIVSLPGEYSVQSETVTTSFVVHPQRDLSFFSEFGIFSFVVSLTIGALLIWLKLRTRPNVNSKEGSSL